MPRNMPTASNGRQVSRPAQGAHNERPGDIRYTGGSQLGAPKVVSRGSVSHPTPLSSGKWNPAVPAGDIPHVVQK